MYRTESTEYLSPEIVRVKTAQRIMKTCMSDSEVLKGYLRNSASAKSEFLNTLARYATCGAAALTVALWPNLGEEVESERD